MTNETVLIIETHIPVNFTCSGSISAGDPVVTGASSGGTNYVAKAVINDENILGVMLEDATDAQTKLMELRPQTMQLA